MRAQISGSDPLETAAQARSAEGAALNNFLFHPSRQVVEALIENPGMSEQHLLVLLSRKDLSREVLVKIARNRDWMNSYPMKLAVLKHPRTPRHLALPLLKFIYLFDLLGVAATPGVPAELKRLAEDAILSQKDVLALGQRISLARRGSARVAAGLLTDRDRQVILAALSNPALTEQAVAAALLLAKSPPELPGVVLHHSRWLIRHSVKLALVRNQHVSLAPLLEILQELPVGELAEVVSDRRVANYIRAYAARIIPVRRNPRFKPGQPGL